MAHKEKENKGQSEQNSEQNETNQPVTENLYHSSRSRAEAAAEKQQRLCCCCCGCCTAADGVISSAHRRLASLTSASTGHPVRCCSCGAPAVGGGGGGWMDDTTDAAGYQSIGDGRRHTDKVYITPRPHRSAVAGWLAPVRRIPDLFPSPAPARAVIAQPPLPPAAPTPHSPTPHTPRPVAWRQEAVVGLTLSCSMYARRR